MQIEDAVYLLLTGDTGGVASFVAGRVFSGVLPQKLDRYPAIEYRPTSRRVIRTLDSGCALVSQRIVVFSTSDKDSGVASRLDAAVSKCLDEYTGTVTNNDASPTESIDIQGVFSGPAHEYGYDDTTKTHQFITEFEFHYLDPVRLDP